MKWGLLLLLLIPTLVFGAENCSMFNGTCKEVCAQNEEGAVGAFLDCTDKQDCCVPKQETRKKPAMPSYPPPPVHKNEMKAR